MNFNQFIAILWARKKIALIILTTTILATLAVSLILPKSYKATATLILNYTGADPVSGAVVPAQLMPGYMATQVDIITSHNVALGVVDGLHLDKQQAAVDQFNEATKGEGNIRDWLADILLKNLDVKPSKESSVINLDYGGADPRFAAALANAFAEAYIQTNLKFKVDPSRQTAEWFNNQIKNLRDDLAKAQTRLSAYQRDKGIVSIEEHLDVENTRLAELSSQLVTAQSQSMDKSSRQQQASKGKRLDESPDILNNPLIQNLKAELAHAETKLADLGLRLSVNHPQYQSALAEVQSLRSKLDRELNTVNSSLGSATNSSQRLESDLRASLAAQKNRVLLINQQRDELLRLQHDVENSQKMLDLAMQRYGQTNMAGQSNQSEVAILNPATAPTVPSKPKVFLNMLISVFVGTMLAVGIALLTEMLDRRVRTPEDILNWADIPLLGVIPPTKLNRQPWFKRIGRSNKNATKSIAHKASKAGTR
jgi:chain length determinant protein EpsF